MLGVLWLGCVGIGNTAGATTKDKSMTKVFIVEQHDQGRTDEVDSWNTKREALARIREIEADIAMHPQWYRHLAAPCWSVREAVDRSEEIYQIVEI